MWWFKLTLRVSPSRGGSKRNFQPVSLALVALIN